MIERRILRQAARAALLGKTRAGQNVDASRPNPITQNPSALVEHTKLPRIVLYTRTTRSQVFDESPRRYRHEVELAAECVLEVGPGQNIDDELDLFEDQALRALLVDDTLGGTVDDLLLTGSRNVVDTAGDRLIAATIISFDAVVYTYAPINGTLELPDLQRVNVEYNLSGEQPDPADRAQSNIEGLDQ